MVGPRASADLKMEAPSTPPGYDRPGIEASAGQQAGMVGAAADTYVDFVL